MKFKLSIAAFAAALVALGVVASAMSARASGIMITAPPATALPTTQVDFGAVPIGTQVVKPILILNRTREWVHYGGASWPNLQYPGAGVQPYPKGFWSVSPGGELFPCWDIAPQSSCTLHFGWLPYEAGAHTATFMTWYVGQSSGTTYSSNTIAMKGAGN